MRIIESYLTKNPCYTAGEKIKPDGLVIQTLWRPQPSAKVMVHNWNRETQDEVCPHAFVDAISGDVYQTLPFDMRGKHSGTDLNEHTIGVMLCEPIGIEHRKGEVKLIGGAEYVTEVLQRTYNSAVELFAKLCKEYGIEPISGIMTYKKRNPEKLWALFDLPTTIAHFKGDVLLKMCESDTKDDEIARMARVDVPNLRIRTGPGREFDSIGKFTGVGEFPIAEIQNGSGSANGWGRLATGEGWISLDHATLL